MNKKILARFNELEEAIKSVKLSKYVTHSQLLGNMEFLDTKIYTEWCFKVKNLIILCCGEGTMYYKEFVKIESINSSNIKLFKKLEALFIALKDDYKNGYLTSIRALITAEVFDNELEQAQELLDSKYHVAAAVIAGTVLETALRELCDAVPINHGKLDKMNADLTKQGVYNKLQNKRITALADIRNSAAHGKSSEFTHDDVTMMIRDIESFLANHLSD